MFALCLFCRRSNSILKSIWPLSPNSSSAPALMSASRDFLFKLRSLTRSRKSERDLKAPFCFLSAIMACDMPSPKFFIVIRPNLIQSERLAFSVKRLVSSSFWLCELVFMACLEFRISDLEFSDFTTVKPLWLSLIDGGKTGIFMRLHSVIISPIFSTSPESAVRTEDI